MWVETEMLNCKCHTETSFQPCSSLLACVGQRDFWWLIPISLLDEVLNWAHSRFFTLAKPWHVFLNQFGPYVVTLREFQFCKTSKDGGTLWPFQGLLWHCQVSVFRSNFSFCRIDLTTPCNNCHVLLPVVYFNEMKQFWFGLWCVCCVLTLILWILQSAPVDINLSVSCQPCDFGYSALLHLTSLW